MNRFLLERELFERTVGLDPAARARVLAECAEADPELRRRVERLAEADTRPLAVLDGTAGELWQALRDDAAPESLRGAAFGAYRVDTYLASGGMAHVYLATRAVEGASRRVALKVLRSVATGADFLARFRREREMLASLEHEHIVTFLDACALEDGRPCLVMEYVEGVPITEWAVTHPLARRIELFLDVLAAVQYAHQKLVVHRDLKPSNVLVTPQGAPKLLDFGIATALGTEDAPESPGPHTPAYASPEQLAGETVTTASDIFSLGVLLSELVVARPANRDGSRVPAELSAIVAKARAPSPEHRYRSADEFAADLRRFLAFEPVHARRAGWFDRARLFARRHRGALVLASCVFLAAIAGWIGSDLRRRAAERDASVGWRAHAQAKTAAAVFEGFIATATSGDPALAAVAAAFLEEELRGPLLESPETETMVRLALADLYLRLGDRDRAALHAERAAQLAKTTRGVGDAERLRAERILDHVRAR